MKIWLKNSKVVLAELVRRNTKLRTNAKSLFELPLLPVLDAIKHNLENGGYDSKGNKINHINTRDLYRNTKSESKNRATPDGFSTSVDFGYFISYGLNLETFAPRNPAPSISALREWRDNKGLAWKDHQLKSLQRKLKTDPGKYPIIQGVWELTKDSVYLVDVYNRVKDTWTN